MRFEIPTIHGASLPIRVDPGDAIFVVGANGTGKSALLQHIVSCAGDAPIRWIAAHRQTWLSSGSVDLTPRSYETFAQNMFHYTRREDARWKDYVPEERLSALLFEVMAKDNERNRRIAMHVDNDDFDAVKAEKAKIPPIFRSINGLLSRGAMTIALENSEGREIRARHWSNNATYSIAQMSDGERNAAIIAANVLTVDPGTILLIDEPERHLHRAIIEPFLSAVFDERHDCGFIVSTHEITLPAMNPAAHVLLIRSCLWGGNKPSAWDVELIQPHSSMPEELKRAILGARKNILFVEGKSESLDCRLYQALFPAVSVRAVGTCEDVRRVVSGLLKMRDEHGFEPFGLIDRDDRSKEEIEDLGKKRLFVLDTYSVESLYYCQDVMRSVAERQAEPEPGGNVENLVQETTNKALHALENKEIAERMAARLCLRKMQQRMLSNLNWKHIKDSESGQIEMPPVESGYREELDRFNKLVAARNLDALLARYPLKDSEVLTNIATSLEFKSRSLYEKSALFKITDNERLSSILKARLGGLADALG